MKNLFSSLHFRLLLIVLFSLVPSLGLILYSTVELRLQAEREIQEEVGQLDHSISLEEDELIGGARQLLVSLGENQRLLTFDRNYSDSLLRNLMLYLPRYANIGVIKPNGDLAASGIQYVTAVNLFDRRFFQKAIFTRQFSVGNFEIGRVTHEPSINFGYPVLSETGEVRAVIFVALDLSWLTAHEQASMSHLEPDSIFAKMDSNGLVVAYHPDSSERIGKPAPWKFVEAMKSTGRGMAEESSPDGIPRIFAYDAVTGSKLFGGDLYVAIGLPKDSLLAVFNRFMVQNTSAMGIVALLVFVFAWISSELLVVRPARAILTTTEELRRGNLRARTGLLHREGDIGRLAFSVDQMAETLQNQDHEHERMIAILTQSEEKYRSLVETSPDAIALLDENFKILMMSPAGLRLTGYERPDQLIGKSFFDFFIPEDKSRLIEEITRTLQVKEVQNLERIIIRENGTSVPVEIRASALGDKNTTFRSIITLLRDISSRKEAEEERKKTQSQLFQAQKMDSIGTLAGGVAHDFNNLLTVIIGHSDYLMSVVDKDQQMYTSLKEIHRASMRAADLTHQLLLFSRRQPMELLPLDISRTVEGLLKMLKRLIGEDIQVETAFVPELWSVLADAGSMEQVIMNIVVNARDAMKAGGTLRIATGNKVIDEGYCALYSFARAGKFVCLSITDTGVGMTQEVISHIFEPFFTTKEMGKGTGLGLSVVYGIVKQHEGWITVRSELGKGSTFDICLPAFSSSSAAAKEEDVSLANLRGRGERILVIEDDESIRNLVQSMLVENGYQVTVAADARTAVEVFEKEKGDFDLILSDVILPDRNGVQLVEDLLSRNPNLKVLLSSGYTDDKSQSGCRKNGCARGPGDAS